MFRTSTVVDESFVARYQWPSLSKRWDRGLANFVTTQLYQGGKGSEGEGGGGGGGGGNATDLVSRLSEHVSNGLRVLVVHGEGERPLVPC